MKETESDVTLRKRAQRILQVADNMLAVGGEAALQMKELADKAAVSLTTLYRHYPSKDHVLLELALSRYQRALRELRSGSTRITGDTAGERAADYCIRQFNRQQREPEVTAALVKGLSQTERTFSMLLEEHARVVRLALVAAVWQDGEPVPPHMEPLLDIIQAVLGKVTRGWLAGTMSAGQARDLIVITCRLLDLPAQVRAELTG